MVKKIIANCKEIVVFIANSKIDASKSGQYLEFCAHIITPINQQIK